MRALLLLPLALAACSEARKPADPAPDRPVATSTIPTAFQGRWGMNDADCDPERADNKGLLTITAGQLKFYESRATPVMITQTGDALALDLNLSGEGQTWSTRTTLRLDGGALVRTEADPPAEYRYKPCA